MAESSQEHWQQVADEADAAKHRLEIERLRQEQLRKQKEQWEQALEQEEIKRRERILAHYEAQRPSLQREVEQQVRRVKRNRVVLGMVVLGSVGILALVTGLFYQNHQHVTALELRHQERVEKEEASRTKRRQDDVLDKSSMLQQIGDLNKKLESLQQTYKTLPPLRKK